MEIDLIKPQTQAKLKKPVLIGAGVLIILGISWITINAVATPDLSANEFYDRTSGTVVDTYTGASSNGDSTNVIYGLSSIEENLPNSIYNETENLVRRFTTYAYPDAQFSYEKDSLGKDAEDNYSFRISSKKYALTIRFSKTDNEQSSLLWLEVLSDNSIIYNYSK